MIYFILVSTLLSLLGYTVYRFWVQKRLGLQLRKRYLYFMVAASLTLPLSFPTLQDWFHLQQTVQIESQSPLVAFRQVPLPALQQFCHCEQPNYSHRFLYRSNLIFNLLIQHKAYLSALVGLAMLGVGVHLLLQLLYLQRLVKGSRIEEIDWQGKNIKLLHPPRAHGLGAFQLDKDYLIWQEGMEKLPPESLSAVLAHELSHLQQFNTLEKALLNFLQCVWLANPVFYALRKELALLSELIADRAAIPQMESPQQYARLLLDLHKGFVPAMAQGLKQHSLKSRIEFILRASPAPRQKMSVALPLVMGALLQLGVGLPVSAKVEASLAEFAQYQHVYQHQPEQEEGYYCTDCESFCVDEAPGFLP